VTGSSTIVSCEGEDDLKSSVRSLMYDLTSDLVFKKALILSSILLMRCDKERLIAWAAIVLLSIIQIEARSRDWTVLPLPRFSKSGFSASTVLFESADLPPIEACRLSGYPPSFPVLHLPRNGG